MKRTFFTSMVCVLSVLVLGLSAFAEPNGVLNVESQKSKAAIIICEGLIDDGLYQSIKRRTKLALDDGADYIIYSIATYGGLVKSADDISKYFILDIADKAHTIAYVKKEAISAGAMMSVSCNDIIMRENTTIGDCAPIVMGQQLEGVEREKTESFIRATFSRAAQANGYPEQLLLAMVTNTIEVYRIKNLETGEYEFFDGEFLPTDPNKYDLENKGAPVSKAGQLLTLTAKQAAEYGVAREIVKDIDGAMTFIADRDGIEFQSNPVVYETSWSEEMVRWLNSPAVTGILFMVGLLGLYIEFNTPGLGLPGLVAVICFAVLFGSKFFVDLANWVEVAIFAVGLILIAIELFVIPGFGIAGIAGIICVLTGLFGMLIKNPPDKLPIPRDAVDWYYFKAGAVGLSLGFFGFLILAWLLAKFLPKLEFFSPLMLTPNKPGQVSDVVMTAPAGQMKKQLAIGDIGVVETTLRPAGTANFGSALVDVVSDGEFIESGSKVEILEIHGNRVLVKELAKEAE